MPTINLMSEGAQFRAAVDRIARLWLAALIVVFAAVTPLCAWSWRQRSQVACEHDALEAQFAPIRRMVAENQELTQVAVSLVRDERTTLALARRRDVTSLLVAVADAVASTEGHVVIEHLTATRDPSAPPDAIDPGGRLLLDVSSTEGYDISLLARALERPPLKSVKIVRSEAVAGAETPHNHHILECQY